MIETIPRLALSHGQVLWCLARGREPGGLIRDQVRYLRQLGIPFDEKETGRGRGNRRSYGFYQLIEVGLAFEGLKRRVSPRFLRMLAENRNTYKKFYREAYLELAKHPQNFRMDVRRGRTTFSPDVVLRLHDRYSETPGKCEMVLEGNARTGRMAGDTIERYADGFEGVVISVKTTIQQLITLATDAPLKPPGPRN